MAVGIYKGPISESGGKVVNTAPDDVFTDEVTEGTANGTHPN